MEGNLEILGRKFKEIMPKLEGNFIFQSGSTGSNSSCSLTLTILNFFNFRFIIILTGIWSELMSAPGIALACLIEFLNLSLIII